MIDKSFIGHTFEPFTAAVEKGRLRFFAKAIGETNPVYFNEEAAIAAGHKSILAPPTFVFSLKLEGDDALPILDLLKLDIARILHGSQSFEYFAPMVAGDTIRIESRIANIFDKKGGALEFVDMESTFTNQDGVVVAKTIDTLVYRNG
jgi:acyl dehydratase